MCVYKYACTYICIQIYFCTYADVFVCVLQQKNKTMDKVWNFPAKKKITHIILHVRI